MGTGTGTGKPGSWSGPGGHGFTAVLVHSGFCPKTGVRSVLYPYPPYPFTRLYPGTGTGTLGNGHRLPGSGFSKPILVRLENKG